MNNVLKLQDNNIRRPIDSEDYELIRFSDDLRNFINDEDSLKNVDFEHVFGPKVGHMLEKDYPAAFAKDYLQALTTAEDQLIRANQEDLKKVDKLAKELGFKDWQALCKGQWRYEGMVDTGLKGDARNSCDLCHRKTRFLHYVTSDTINLSLKFSANCGGRFFRVVARANNEDGYLKFNSLKTLEAKIIQDLRAQVFMFVNKDKYKYPIDLLYYSYVSGNAARALISKGISGLRRTFVVCPGQDLNDWSQDTLDIIYGVGKKQVRDKIPFGQLRLFYYSCLNIAFEEGSNLLPLKDRTILYKQRSQQEIASLDNGFYINWAKCFVDAGLPVGALIIDKLNKNMQKVGKLYGVDGDIDLVELLYSLELENCPYLFKVFSFLGTNILEAKATGRNRHVETVIWGCKAEKTLANKAYAMASFYRALDFLKNSEYLTSNKITRLESEAKNILSDKPPVLKDFPMEGVTGFTVDDITPLSLQETRYGMGINRWGEAYSYNLWSNVPLVKQTIRSAHDNYGFKPFNYFPRLARFIKEACKYNSVNVPDEIFTEDYLSELWDDYLKVLALREKIKKLVGVTNRISSAKAWCDSYEKICNLIDDINNFGATIKHKEICKYKATNGFRSPMVTTLLCAGSLCNEDFEGVLADRVFMESIKDSDTVFHNLALVAEKMESANPADVYRFFEETFGNRSLLLDVKYKSVKPDAFMTDQLKKGIDMLKGLAGLDDLSQYNTFISKMGDESLFFELVCFLTGRKKTYKSETMKGIAAVFQLYIDTVLDDATKKEFNKDIQKAKPTASLTDIIFKDIELADSFKRDKVPFKKYSVSDFDANVDYKKVAEAILSYSVEHSVASSIRSISERILRSAPTKSQCNCLHNYWFNCVLDGQGKLENYYK